ncbi:MAG: hypothetical protein JW955_06910 [Sedimentisphaerales bacterium]|nr:hypothetical protein [Sedimentisphaerales bacterium]
MSTSGAKLAIAGHAGIGHTLCPGGLIQDDSLGFSVAAAIIRDVLGADTRVASAVADPDTNIITVTTVDGGTADASPRCGVTPSEARLIGDVAGRDALLCQTLAVEALGRVYGQGVLETSAALQAALANAVIDTFRRKAPDRFQATTEDLPTNDGHIGGLSTELEGVSASVLAIVNGSSSGIGPNEDLEGNVALGSKRDLMERLGMLRCPTIVLEGKAYSPALSGELKEITFLVRVQKDLDNIVVAEALRDAALDLGYPVIYLDDAFPRNEGVLRRKTVDVAERIAAAAARLGQSERGADKVLASAELARLVGQEVGGVSFMTNRLHDVVRQCGLMPGTSAVLSMLVTKDYLAHWKMPVLEQEDIDRMKDIVHAAIPRIASRLHEANDVLDQLYEDLEPLEAFIR